MSKETPLLKLKNVSKFYYNKGLVASGFSKVSLEFNLGEFVVITGESGSGKSTLLNVLSGIDSYEEGEMYINGEETSHYSEADFEDYRKTYIGNIFQAFNLVNSYTVYQNIELVLLLNGYDKKNVHDRIIDLIKKVDLYKYRNTRVSRLSGGQKQRVAIARALAKDTPIIIADEPTGNLDSKSAKSVVKLLSEIASDKLVIIVTHNYDQVESYATRKIEMHDGKVREDIILKDTNKKEIVLYNYKNISFKNKIRLGIRNTFNILPKFLLTFGVFLFVVLAFLDTYSSFRKLEYQESKFGYNNFFHNTSDERIIINKKDGSYISDNDFKKIENLNNVSYIEKNDILLDTQFYLNNDNYYFNGYVESIKNITEVSEGRLPENEYEVLIKGNEYDYYLQNVDKLYEQNFKLYSNYGNEIEFDKPLKVVGVIYDNEVYEDTIFVSDVILDNIRKSLNEIYSKLKVTLNDNVYNVNNYETYMNVTPNKNVNPGEAIVSNDINYLCKNSWCRNNDIKIEISNIYFKESINVNITNLYTKNNISSMLGIKDYENNNGRIYISYEDYNKLYNKNTFQSSVFANDVKNVDSLANDLDNLGYKVLKMKDSTIDELGQILKVIKIFKFIVTIVLCIVLFFITYFVIKLIQKSKNVYYSTVRILGGSKKVIKDLITIELMNVFNLAYFVFIMFIGLCHMNILHTEFLDDLIKYLSLKDYILIYLILSVMSYLISMRYSRKLFKTSAMKAYNEEV